VWEYPSGAVADYSKVDVRLPEKRNSNSHGAKPVNQIISTIKWMQTRRLSMKNSIPLGVPRRGRRGRACARTAALRAAWGCANVTHSHTRTLSHTHSYPPTPTPTHTHPHSRYQFANPQVRGVCPTCGRACARTAALRAARGFDFRALFGANLVTYYPRFEEEQNPLTPRFPNPTPSPTPSLSRFVG